MARQMRIEFPVAVDHCMVRGERREDIVRSGEPLWSSRGAVWRTEWEMSWWVLMGNPHRLVFRTPKLNREDGIEVAA